MVSSVGGDGGGADGRGKRLSDAVFDDAMGEAAGGGERSRVAGDLPGDVSAVDHEAELLGDGLRIGHAGSLDNFVDDVLDRALIAGRELVGRVVRQGEFDRGVDEDAAVVFIRVDQVFNDVEQRVQLIDRRPAARLADHPPEALLQLIVEPFEHGEH